MLANSLGEDELDGQVEVLDQAIDDRALLCIFLSEYSDLRLHDVEQLRHHRSDAVEVTGAAVALERTGNTADTDHRRVTRRIHFILRRKEQQFDLLVLQ